MIALASIAALAVLTVVWAAGSWRVMTRRELAEQLAQRNDRCGHSDDETICLRAKGHQGAHQPELIRKVIPIT